MSDSAGTRMSGKSRRVLIQKQYSELKLFYYLKYRGTVRKWKVLFPKIYENYRIIV